MIQCYEAVSREVPSSLNSDDVSDETTDGSVVSPLHTHHLTVERVVSPLHRCVMLPLQHLSIRDAIHTAVLLSFFEALSSSVCVC